MENSDRFERPSYENRSERKPLQLRKKSDMNFNNERRSNNSFNNDRRPSYGNNRNNSGNHPNRFNSNSGNSFNNDGNNRYGNNEQRYGNNNRHGNNEGGSYNSGERRNNYGNNERYGNNNNRYGNNESGGYNNERRNNYGNSERYGNNNRYGNNEGGSYNNERRNNYGNSEGGGYNNSERRNNYGDGNRPNYNRPNNYNNNNNRFDKPRNNNYQQNNNDRYGDDSQKVNFRPRKNSVEGKERKSFSAYKEVVDLTKPVRLNKYLANAGICSRREADEYIQAGVISVNDVIVTELGTKVLPTDKIMFHEQTVRTERKIYLILNKPKDYVTTVEDTHDRKTVMDLVKTACSERIYPVGRLDRNTTGVLLFTNDGDLAARLTHPKYEKKKIYDVVLDRDLEEEDFNKILNEGVELDDGIIKADDLAFVKEDSRKKVGIEIHSGKNRVVRRLFDKLGYKVRYLDRVYFAGLTKKNLPRGKFRFLNGKEISTLKMGAYE
jgi:23S rRNA pseudouridine2605 synthase